MHSIARRQRGVGEYEPVVKSPHTPSRLRGLGECQSNNSLFSEEEGRRRTSPPFCRIEKERCQEDNNNCGTESEDGGFSPWGLVKGGGAAAAKPASDRGDRSQGRVIMAIETTDPS